MKKKRDRVRVRELEVERLIVREPRAGRVRAVIETVVPRQGRAARVALTLFAPDGEPMLVAQVDHRGQPQLSVGNPARRQSTIVTREAVDLWSAGNVAASVRTDRARGIIELLPPVQARRPRKRAGNQPHR